MFLPAWMPTAIAYAPNFGKQTGVLPEARAEQLDTWGISQQLRIAVGPPSALLSVWIMEPSRRPLQGTVLLLHGIRDSKSSMRGMGQVLADGGFRSVLIDLRGHGSSTGDWLTYGVVDSQDLTQVLDALDRRNLLAEPVGVFGCSYGAATASSRSSQLRPAHWPRFRTAEGNDRPGDRRRRPYRKLPAVGSQSSQGDPTDSHAFCLFTARRTGRFRRTPASSCTLPRPDTAASSSWSRPGTIR